jgi:hypothetical protein
MDIKLFKILRFRFKKWNVIVNHGLTNCRRMVVFEVHQGACSFKLYYTRLHVNISLMCVYV